MRCSLFLFLAAVMFGQPPPYPPSAVIDGIDWDLDSRLQHGLGSDQWPLTWAADGDLYSAWGDGWGWVKDDDKKSIGITRISGSPPALEGEDLWGDGPGSGFAKPEALVAIDDVLYMFWTIESANDLDETSTAISRDGGRTWEMDHAKAFPQMPEGWRVRAICQFGPGYAGSRDSFVYVYFARSRAGDIYLSRVPKDRIFQPAAYEWYAGLESAEPRWSAFLTHADPVFEDPAGYLWHLGVSYNPGLGRYLLTKPHYAPDDNRDAWQARDAGIGSLGVFDAPEPWGPWTTVFYEDNFLDELTKFSYFLPPKFFSADGRDFWLVFSGWPEYDNVNLIRGRFRLTGSLTGSRQ